MLRNKPRGVPQVNDRRVLNGIFWVLRSGAPWRDLPEAFGPYAPESNSIMLTLTFVDHGPLLAIGASSTLADVGGNAGASHE
jgi:Putative transposase of IS4/5 family (DUF4096)